MPDSGTTKKKMPGFISMHVREIFYEKDFFLPVDWQSGELGSLLQHDSFVDIVWCVASFIFDDPLPLASAAKFNAEFPEFSDTCSDVHCGSCCHGNRVLPQRLTTASQACRWPVFTFLRYANENSEGMLKLRNHADINNQQIRKQAFWLMTDIFVASRVDWTIAIDSCRMKRRILGAERENCVLRQHLNKMNRFFSIGGHKSLSSIMFKPMIPTSMFLTYSMKC